MGRLDWVMEDHLPPMQGCDRDHSSDACWVCSCQQGTLVNGGVGDDCRGMLRFRKGRHAHSQTVQLAASGGCVLQLEH